MNINKEEIQEKAKNMKLSELSSRIEEISLIFKSGQKNVIDELIPLSEEVKILKTESDKRLGDLEEYLKENT